MGVPTGISDFEWVGKNIMTGCRENIDWRLRRTCRTQFHKKRIAMKNCLLMILLGCGTAYAEWYRVDSVPAYNTIKATQADGEKEPIVIRIRNLEKIEYIQSDPEKVLIGGEEAISLAKSVLKGQLVWVENLQTEEGAYVADVYPSFEQVITVYKEKRLVNGDNISASIKEKLKAIYKQMLADLDLASLSTKRRNIGQPTADEIDRTLHSIYMTMLSNILSDTPKIMSTANTKKGEDVAKLYDGNFQRAVFTADAIAWFRKEGQHLQPTARKLFVDLLEDFQSDNPQTARYTLIKLQTIMEKEKSFRELFLNEANFERGKFTYTCIEWFKDRGQYLPDDVQNVFVNWLRIYQRTPGTEGDFMKQRLQWMLDNNGLYQDFLDLGN